MEKQNITIEKINPTDIKDIIVLLKKLYLELGEEKECTPFINESLISDFINHDTYLIFKACENNNIVGFITLSESQAIYCGGKYGLIDELYVKPEYRSKKVGALLIQKAKKIGVKQKWMRIAVTAPSDNNTRALNFYKENKFVFAGPKLSYTMTP